MFSTSFNLCLIVLVLIWIALLLWISKIINCDFKCYLTNSLWFSFWYVLVSKDNTLPRGLLIWKTSDDCTLYCMYVLSVLRSNYVSLMFFLVFSNFGGPNLHIYGLCLRQFVRIGDLIHIIRLSHMFSHSTYGSSTWFQHKYVRLRFHPISIQDTAHNLINTQFV